MTVLRIVVAVLGDIGRAAGIDHAVLAMPVKHRMTVLRLAERPMAHRPGLLKSRRHGTWGSTE